MIDGSFLFRKFNREDNHTYVNLFHGVMNDIIKIKFLKGT